MTIRNVVWCNRTVYDSDHVSFIFQDNAPTHFFFRFITVSMQASSTITSTSSTCTTGSCRSKDGLRLEVEQQHGELLREELFVQPRFQMLASMAGNILEWYDFAVFGFFADIIGQVFFPSQQHQDSSSSSSTTTMYQQQSQQEQEQHFDQILKSFAIFGGAFLMRPIGGMLMGWIGDRYGRKKALEISIFLMAMPTFAMGCLPTPHQVGRRWSVVLLILVRLLQGLSVGGQLVSSLVYTLEQQKDRSAWGLYGSYVLASANFGTLLGGLVAASLRAALTEQQMLHYGWRLPFLSGILVSICGFYLKYACHEDFHPSTTASMKNPWTQACSNVRALVASCLVPMVWAAGFYMSFVWMSIYMEKLVTPPVPYAFWVNSCALLVLCLFFPAAGILSDRHGRSRVMTIGGFAFAVMAPLCFVLIGRGDAILAFCAQSCLGICLSLWGAPMMAWLVEHFPSDARLTSVAIGYNVAQSIMGGATPSIATLMSMNDVWYANPGLLLMVIALCSLFGLHCVATTTMARRELLAQDDEASQGQHFCYS